MVSGGESATVEFKRKVAYPEKIIKELVAFANTAGGYLFIGVNDDGSIPGLKFPEDNIYALEKAIKSYCFPPLPYSIEEIEVTEGRWVVVVKVEDSGEKPHYILSPEDGQRKLIFVRSKDKSIQASREMKEIIRRRANPRNIKFHFGEKERKLFAYLEDNQSITLEDFQKLADISPYRASRTLVILTLANVLEIVPDNKGDQYTLAHDAA